MKVRDEARPHFEQAAASGTPAQRAAAIRWLGRNAREASREFLLAHREAEKSAKLQEAINEALGEARQESSTPQAETSLPGPPLPAVEKEAPLSPSARQAVVALIEAYNRAATDVNQQARNIANNTRRIRRPICRSTANRSSSCFAVGWNSPI